MSAPRRQIAWIVATAASGVVVAATAPPAFLLAVMPAALFGIVLPAVGLMGAALFAFVGDPIVVSSIKIAPSDILILLPAVGVVYLYANNQIQIGLPLVAKFVAIFTATAATSMLAAADKGEAFLGLVQIVELWLIPVLVMRAVLRTPADRLLFLRILVFGLLVGAVASLAIMLRNYAQGDDLFAATRGLGGGFQGYFMTFGLLFVISCLLSRRSVFGERLQVVAWPALGAFGLALVATQTRGAWIAASLGVLILLARVQTRRFFVALPAFILAVLVAGPSLLPFLPTAIVERASALIDPDPSTSFAAAQSNQIRLELARLSLVFWETSPLVGVGIKNFRGELEAYSGSQIPLSVDMPGLGPVNLDGPHNFLLRVLAEQGVIGLLALLALGLVLIRAAYRWSTRLERTDRLIGHFSVAALASIGVFCLFSELLGAGALAFVFAGFIPSSCDD